MQTQGPDHLWLGPFLFPGRGVDDATQKRLVIPQAPFLVKSAVVTLKQCIRHDIAFNNIMWYNFTYTQHYQRFFMKSGFRRSCLSIAELRDLREKARMYQKLKELCVSHVEFLDNNQGENSWAVMRRSNGSLVSFTSESLDFALTTEMFTGGYTRDDFFQDVRKGALESPKPPEPLPLSDRESGAMQGEAAYFATDMRAFYCQAVLAERARCLALLDNHPVPLGNSAAGEMACDLAMDALRELRDQIARGDEVME